MERRLCCQYSPQQAFVNEIIKIQQSLRSSFPYIAITPQEGLHITLFDFLAPLVTYQRPTLELFEERKNEYLTCLEGLFIQQKPITVQFTKLVYSPNAVYLQGIDDGSFQRLRDNMLSKIKLEDGTKQPPKIIHCTIGRFSTALLPEPRFEKIVDIAAVVSNFRLIRELETPMRRYEIIREYNLLQ